MEVESKDNGVFCSTASPRLARHARTLGWVLAITTVFMLVEVAGGLWANSLALLADAGHMLSDVGALALALFVARLAQRPATPKKTYGYLRYEILAALINGSALFVIAGLIVWEAWKRIAAPPEVNAPIMLVVATVGLAVNALAASMLHRRHRDSLNVRGAYLHVLGDLLGSVGALVAGAVIWATGWVLVDPLISVVVAGLILLGAWRLVSESVDVLMENTPSHIALRDVEHGMASIDGVSEVHDLHVWTLTSGVVAMTGHAVVDDLTGNQRILETINERMMKLGIDHVTVQLETEHLCPPSEVG